MMKSIFMIQTMTMMFIILIYLIMMIPTLSNKIHPLFLSLMLFILIILSSMMLSMSNSNHWYSYVMFLIMIGGLMIIFMYFISFINNSKLYINLINIFIMMLNYIMFIIFYIKYIMNYNLLIFWNNNNNEMINLISLNNNNNNYNIQMNYLYTHMKNIFTILSIIYLLMCMSMIVKIMINNKITLRKIN